MRFFHVQDDIDLIAGSRFRRDSTSEQSILEDSFIQNGQFYGRCLSKWMILVGFLRHCRSKFVCFAAEKRRKCEVDFVLSRPGYESVLSDDTQQEKCDRFAIVGTVQCKTQSNVCVKQCKG